jgi:hypothetical protein
LGVVSVKSEVLALIFGMLLILVTFGDAHLDSQIGNLDTIFGLTYWKLLDVIYPVASIIVFLLYGKIRNGIKLNLQKILILISFLIGLSLISIDDIAVFLNLQIHLSHAYWIIIEWIYPIYSAIAFFFYGKTK